MIRLPLRAKPSSHFLSQKLYNKSYFEAARSLRNRSILDVCEDSENEADAERALLYNFYFIFELYEQYQRQTYRSRLRHR